MPPKPVLLHVQRDYPGLSLAAAWNLLSNTDHLDRSIGLAPVSYGPMVATTEEIYREAHTKVLPFLEVRYSELPYEWVYRKEYSVERLYHNGPFVQSRFHISFLPNPHGTTVGILAQVTPRNLIGKAAAHTFLRNGGRKIQQYIEQYASGDGLKGNGPLPRMGNPPQVFSERLDRMLASLRQAPVDQQIVDHLVERLRIGTDDEVVLIRPFHAAKEWNADRNEVLRAFLYATLHGLLTLSWEMMCPNCRVPRSEHRSLSELPDTIHCDTCGVRYGTDFDRYVELRFSVDPKVREAKDQIYCLSGPYRTPHILIQRYLPAGASVSMPVNLAEEPHRFRIIRANQSLDLFVSKEGAPSAMAHFDGEAWNASSLVLRPGEVTIEIKNTSPNPIVAVLEKVEWDPDAVTAARVTVLQEFRDLFGSEVLSPGQQVGIRNLTVLFTDLKGSTSMYEEVGDAKAYGMVWKHFDFLKEKISLHHGSMVRTIGDAVMAVFHSPEDAFAGALDIQRGISEFNRKYRINPPINIKIGLHHGNAIAVNSNNLLDYFGRTVNMAARIQGQSQGGDVVLTREVFLDPAVQRVLNNGDFSVSHFNAHLKGIEAERDLVRLELQGGPESGPPNAHTSVT